MFIDDLENLQFIIPMPRIPWMTYESYLAAFSEAVHAQAEDASWTDQDFAAELWQQGDLIWDKAMRAAAHGA